MKIKSRHTKARSGHGAALIGCRISTEGSTPLALSNRLRNFMHLVPVVAAAVPLAGCNQTMPVVEKSDLSAANRPTDREWRKIQSKGDDRRPPDPAIRHPVARYKFGDGTVCDCAHQRPRSLRSWTCRRRFSFGGGIIGNRRSRYCEGQARCSQLRALGGANRSRTAHLFVGGKELSSRNQD